jgi:diacylglycerol kinase (ATP)
MKKVRIIINPISGTGKQEKAILILKKLLDKSLFESEIMYSKRKGHLTILAKEAAEKDYDAVVVLGGDGSVNEAAKGLIGTNTVLGIIPIGSGNGLARFLHIPLSLKQAVQRLNQFNIKRIDTAKINKLPFVSISGLGFDAHVAKQFDQSRIRGLWNYTKISLLEYYRFVNQKYLLNIDGKAIDTNAFMVVFANSNQFGNNIIISPQAKIDDGLLDVCIVQKPTLYQIPNLLLKVFFNKTHKSKLVEIYRAKQINIELETSTLLNLDGETITQSGNLDIEVNPLSLSVII